MKRYAIWDKTSPIIVPTGRVFTAEEWMQEHPVAALPNITVVCAAGEINGGIFNTLGSMIQRAEYEGCDFSNCNTNEEMLARIEEFEVEKRVAAEAAAAEAKAVKSMNDELTATSLASIAASMEYQNMLTLEDVEEV